MTDEKKPKTELVDCAEALRNFRLSTPTSFMEKMIEEGHLHLKELKAAVNCNPMQIAALTHRLDHAEDVLKRKGRI